jgi:hypothetical protein
VGILVASMSSAAFPSHPAFVDVDMTEMADDGALFTVCAFRSVRFNASSARGAVMWHRAGYGT